MINSNEYHNKLNEMADTFDKMKNDQLKIAQEEIKKIKDPEQRRYMELALQQGIKGELDINSFIEKVKSFAG